MRLMHVGIIVVLVLGLILLAGSGARSEREDQPKIAMIDVFEVIDEMMRSPAYTAEIAAVQEQWRQTLQAIVIEIENIQRQLQVLAPNSEEYQAAIIEFNNKEQLYREQDAKAALELDQLRASQVSALMLRLAEHAEIVANKTGHAMVLASRPPNDRIEPVNLNAAVQEVLARSVLYAPGAADITQQVIESIKAE